MQECQNVLKKKFSVSLENHFILCFHIYFSASSDFYFLVSDRYSEISVMVSFNIETLNSAANPPLYTSFIKFDVAIATYKTVLKMAVVKDRVNKMEMEKLR